MKAGLAQHLFVLIISVTAVHSQILKGPANALKKVGDSVTLECVTSGKNCVQVEWIKQEGAQSARKVYTNGIILNGFSDGRYSVNSTGGCSLTITQLEIGDSGRFTCVLTVGDRERTRSSILVVVIVSESCRSNVANKSLNQYDRYNFWTVITVPAKSVESSNVILSFQNKTVDETETVDDSQSQTVKTTLTGIASKENITSRGCMASFLPNTAAGFDNSAATLDVCQTAELFVSYPVENIAVSPPGPYYFGTTVRCTAEGHPFPTFKWTHLRSGQVVDGDNLLIVGEARDEYTCTAMNTVKGKTTSLNKTIDVFSPTLCRPGASVIGVLIFVLVVVIVTKIVIIRVLISLVGWRLGLRLFYFHLLCCLKKNEPSCKCRPCCACCTCFACCTDDKVRKEKLQMRKCCTATE